MPINKNSSHSSRSRSIDGVMPTHQGRKNLHNGPSPDVNKVERDVTAPQATSIYEHSTSNSPNKELLASPAALSLAEPKQGSRRHVKRHLTWKRVLKRIVLGIIVIIVIIAGWLGWKLYRNEAKISKNNNPFHLFSALSSAKLKSQNGRVNVLLAGWDPSDGDQTTDTIMVVSIDTINHSAFMLSIPRDTWVNIPGWNHEKINASNDVSNFNMAGYPKGGMGELEYVISKYLGIPIDYYALVNNAAFKDAVNAVGGVDVNIQSPDPRGIFDPNIAKANNGPLLLSNGWHHLNGQQALNLASARGDPCSCGGRIAYGLPNGDFDRTQHQRQILIALKDKVLSTGVLANPIKISQLLDSIGNNVKTDVQLDDIQSFYSLAGKLSDSNILSLSLNSIFGQTLIENAYINNLDVEVPTAGVDNFSQIQTVINELFSNNPVVEEYSNVVVLNGGSGLNIAAKQANILVSKGMNVSTIATNQSTFRSALDFKHFCIKPLRNTVSSSG